MGDQNQKKVAIILDEMSIGGIPKACISFANQLCLYCEVTIIMRKQQWEFKEQLSEKVHCKIVSNISVSTIFKILLQNKRIITLLKLGFDFCKATYIEKRWVKASDIISKTKPLLDIEDYDCAIAYHGMSINHLMRTLYQVNAKKKIAWIHGDHPFEGIHKSDAAKVYREFDLIYCVSETTRQKFLGDFPNVTDITEVYYNLFEVDDIVKKSQLYTPHEFNSENVNLVTVGRVSQEKGQEMIPNIMELLLKHTEKTHWYIVGDGPDKPRIEQLVKDKGLENHIHFLGAKDNPYPYMLYCDVYVQPSYTEGYPLTIFEAAILGKTIVATAVGGAKEHLTDGQEIVFVEHTPKSIAAGVETLLFAASKKQEIEKNLKDRDFSNSTEIYKLLSLLNV